MTQNQNPEDVQGILNTLLVPMDPPNRSQWRKLELAMKFINISKQSVANSRRLQVGKQIVATLTPLTLDSLHLQSHEIASIAVNGGCIYVLYLVSFLSRGVLQNGF